MLRKLLTLVLALWPQVAPAEDAGLRAELAARYGEMKAAMSAQDQAALEAILAPGFESIDMQGRSTDAAAMLASIMARPRDPNRQSQTEIGRLEGAGDAVDLVQTWRMTSRKADAEGAWHEVGMIAVSAERWIRSDGVWRILRTKTLEVTLLSDGKVTAHRVAR